MSHRDPRQKSSASEDLQLSGRTGGPGRSRRPAPRPVSWRRGRRPLGARAPQVAHSQRPLDPNIAAALGGDAAAQRKIIDRLVRPIGQGVKRVLGPTRPQEQREEAAQEALLSAYQSLPRFRGTGSLEGWAYIIARYAAMRYLSREGASRMVVPSDDPIWEDTHSRPSSNPEVALTHRRAVAHLVDVHTQVLSRRERQVFAGTWLEELSAREIGDQLGIDECNVRVVRHNARARIKTYYLHQVERRPLDQIAALLGKSPAKIQRILDGLPTGLEPRPRHRAPSARVPLPAPRRRPSLF